MKKIFQLLVIIIFITGVHSIYGQNHEISGIIIVLESERSVAGMNITVKGTDISGKVNRKGRFFLTIPDTLQELEFENPNGMKVTEVKKVNENEYTIYLSDFRIDDFVAMTLSELQSFKIITAGKKEQKISNIPASAVVVTKGEIELFGYQSLTEAASGVLGYYVIDDRGQEGSDLGVRGVYAGKSIIIMVNGIRQVFPPSEKYPLNFINVPIEAVEKIEFIRGPMSVIYGSGAFFGAINIITNEDFTSKNLAVSIGNKEQRKIFLSTSESKENLDVKFTLGVELFKGDDIALNDISTDPKTLLGEPLKNQTTGTEAFSGKQLYVNALANMGEFYFDITQSYINKGFTTVVLPFPGNVQELDYLANFAKFGWNKKINKSIEINFNIDHIYRSNVKRYALVSADDYGENRALSAAYDAGFDLFYTSGKKIELTAGLFFRSIYKIDGLFDTDPMLVIEFTNQRSGIKSPINNYGGFTQIKYNPFKKLSIYGGLRIEQFSSYDIYRRNDFENNPVAKDILKFEEEIPQSDIQLIPQLEFIYTLNNKNVIKLMYGQATSRASSSINQNVLITNYEDSTNTPFPTPGIIHTLELNYLGELTKWMNVNFSIYRNELTDLIVSQYSYEDEHFLKSIKNGGRISTTGSELEFRFKFNKKLGASTAVAYQNSKNVTLNDTKLMGSPELLTYLKAYYKIGKLYKNKFDLSVSAYANYVDAMESSWDDNPSADSPVLDPNDPLFIPVGRIAEKTSSYTLVGMNLKIDKFIHEKLFFNFNISNLTDVVYHAPVHIDIPVYDKGMVGYRRSILFSLGISF